MSKIFICAGCETEYDRDSRKGQPGKLTVCEDCAESEGDVEQFTGAMIYGHKCGAQLQINADPKLTSYILNATKLKNKGSNLGNNLKVSSHMNTRTTGACVVTVDATDYKGKNF